MCTDDGQFTYYWTANDVPDKVCGRFSNKPVIIVVVMQNRDTVDTVSFVLHLERAEALRVKMDRSERLCDIFYGFYRQINSVSVENRHI